MSRFQTHDAHVATLPVVPRTKKRKRPKIDYEKHLNTDLVRIPGTPSEVENSTGGNTRENDSQPFNILPDSSKKISFNILLDRDFVSGFTYVRHQHELFGHRRDL